MYVCSSVYLPQGNVFSSGLDLEEHAPTFMKMTSPSPVGDTTKDPARKSFEIARFVAGMQESLASLDRYGLFGLFRLLVSSASRSNKFLVRKPLAPRAVFC